MRPPASANTREPTAFPVGGTVDAESTARPLRFTPRLDLPGQQLIVAGYTDARERDEQVADTFGSVQWLWSENDFFRFDKDRLELCSATFYLPPRAAPHGAKLCREAPVPSSAPAGLRAGEPTDFELPQATVFRCASDGAELVCLRTPGLLARQPYAVIGIAPDVDLLIHDGALTGWRLSDPARWLTDGFARPFPPSDAIPAPSARTRHHLAECLRLTSAPVVDAVLDQDPAAWRDLLALQRAVHAQAEDRARADVLQSVLDRLVEDNGE
ncbi:hypothetical protein [Streptomyces sp. NPDC049813]|uniref:hypothetical protein n=1 Tax=Streptomyces sp. NPDC049813 TaxID=3365597 RepID=UPI0037938298